MKYEVLVLETTSSLCFIQTHTAKGKESKQVKKGEITVSDLLAAGWEPISYAVKGETLEAWAFKRPV